ncbi:putative peptidase family-domain-containing protein [Blyttiomyces helicus]|uniref:Putative peptidase family-domain-containing protein n=1 Tax=Blyttiomyces helicus TaxID=388810 RepID=A0A4P9W8D2_9FUNG|nr:putative peptidase family-domain-containing protein [Blyttiomyces helicus]|eukprot:RKO86426.1 putative peptidase family-domain-containing protein [Blyttiomyces helicus]
MSPIPVTPPQPINVAEGETVYQRVLLIYGTASVDTTHIAVLSSRGVPAQTWPCTGGKQRERERERESLGGFKTCPSNLTHHPPHPPDTHWKALVPLEPGLNVLTLRADPSGAESSLRINYAPQMQNPPLTLVILVGKDSPLVFDVPNHKKDQATLDQAIRRLRMNAYMWQAFTAEQMVRNGFGRRTFRLNEELAKDTIFDTDHPDALRMTAKVHIVRALVTTAEIQGLDSDKKPLFGKHYPNPDLYDITLKALAAHGAPFDRPCYVAGLLLDSRWDPASNATRGHVALGGGSGHVRLGIFGSHLTHAWPAYLGEIEKCLLDNTPNDLTRTANDNGESDPSYKAFCIGSGAFLHEVGHSLTLAHTPSGIMSRGFNHFNRTFMTREISPKGETRPITPADEEGSHWHRADIIRLRHHPCLRLPTDTPDQPDPNSGGPTFYALVDGILVRSGANISLVEWWRDPDGGLAKWIEPPNLPRELTIPVPTPAHDSLRLEITCTDQSSGSVHAAKFLRESIVNPADLPVGLTPDLGPIHRSGALGARGSPTTHSPPQSFSFALVADPSSGIDADSLPCRIRVYGGAFVDGIEVFLPGGASTLFGSRGGVPSDVAVGPRALKLDALGVRAGAWIDGVELVFEGGGRSGWLGGRGGAMYVLRPPGGYSVVGVTGHAADLVDEFALLYRKD